MAPEIRFNNGKACEATTWVCKVPDCSLPFFGEALHEAEMRGMHLGLHLESRSVLLHFESPQTSQGAQRKLAVVLGKGGSIDKAIEDMQSLDPFHGESWGFVKLNAPTMPDSDYLDTVVEEDELSEVESEDEDEDPQLDAGPFEASVPEVSELAAPSPDLFALVVQKKVRIPALNKALGMETSYQKELREAMEKAGGPLSEDLKKDLFPRGMQHAKEVQDEKRALIRMKETLDEIFWITSPPEYINVYIKPNMSTARRLEWILWKAGKLNMELTLPVFMAFFKQVTCYPKSKVRLMQFKAMVEEWQGEPLDWMSLPVDERNLINSINEGKTDCYCKNCNRVLDPKATTQFCSSLCASYFCNCGEKFKVKMVTDYEQLGRLQKRVGPYDDLVKLARMLEHKAEVDKYQNVSDVTPKFDELTEERQKRKCCEAVEGCVDKRWCKRCLDEFQGINYIKNCVWDIRSGKVTWGHCEEAARRLKIMAEIPLPKMEEKSCNAEACQPPRKKARN